MPASAVVPSDYVFSGLGKFGVNGSQAIQFVIALDPDVSNSNLPLMEQVYVSVTGLKLRAFWHAPRFWRMAGAAMASARSAAGNRYAGARTIAGYHHTLSVWDNKEAMMDFVFGTVHHRAIKAFPDIAMGKTIGYYAECTPDWDSALMRWSAEAVDYVAGPNE